MSVPQHHPLEPAHVLSTLELASRALTEIVDRVDAARAAAAGLLTATDWQTVSAQRFHRRAEGWQGDLDALRDTARMIDDEVGAARRRALEAAWWAGA